MSNIVKRRTKNDKLMRNAGGFIAGGIVIYLIYKLFKLFK